MMGDGRACSTAWTNSYCSFASIDLSSLRSFLSNHEMVGAMIAIVPTVSVATKKKIHSCRWWSEE